MHRRVAWALALAAPLTVAVCLLVLRSVWAVFLVYHLGICLLVPLAAARSARRPGSGMLALLGLAPRRGLGLGLALGGALAAGLPLASLALPQLLPDPARLADALAGWGVAPPHAPLVLVFLGLVGGPAEELFWRGWLHGRLVAGRPRPVLRAGALIAAFTSYHAVTLAALAPTATGAALLTTGVAVAAAAWTWLRIRTGTVWPALLAHAGAAAGYVLVAATRLA